MSKWVALLNYCLLFDVWDDKNYGIMKMVGDFGKFFNDRVCVCMCIYVYVKIYILKIISIS